MNNYKVGDEVEIISPNPKHGMHKMLKVGDVGKIVSFNTDINNEIVAYIKFPKVNNWGFLIKDIEPYNDLPKKCNKILQELTTLEEKFKK